MSVFSLRAPCEIITAAVSAIRGVGPRAHMLDATNPDQLSCQQALIVIRDY